MNLNILGGVRAAYVKLLSTVVLRGKSSPTFSYGCMYLVCCTSICCLWKGWKSKSGGAFIVDHVFYSSLPESGFHGVVERQLFYSMGWGRRCSGGESTQIWKWMKAASVGILQNVAISRRHYCSLAAQHAGALPHYVPEHVHRVIRFQSFSPGSQRDFCEPLFLSDLKSPPWTIEV